MGQVGEAEPAMQDRRVAYFELIASLHQLACRTTVDRTVGAEVPDWRGRRHTVTAFVEANSVGAPPVTRNITGPVTRPPRAASIKCRHRLGAENRVQEYRLGSRDQGRGCLPSRRGDSVAGPDVAVHHPHLGNTVHRDA